MTATAAIPGAVVDDSGLAHLGDPLREQRALAAGDAVAVLDRRTVLSVAGEDRLSWLDSLTSQALKALAPGVGTELLVLDPQGHVEYAAAVVDDGETTWLIVDDPVADGLLTWLQRMRFRLRVDPHDRSDEFGVLGGTAAATGALPAAACWADPWPHVGTGGWGYAVTDPHPGGDWDWSEAIVPRVAIETLLQEAARGERALTGYLAADALRVAAWRPAAAEADGRTLPHEVDWLRTAVHLDKGCYRGQETVAKVHNLGHPPRRLVALQLDGSEVALPEAGAPVFLADSEVGQITSVARHFEEGPVALALVKRTAPTDAVLSVSVADGGTIAAAQEMIVPPDAGRAANVPRLPRLGRRR